MKCNICNAEFESEQGGISGQIRQLPVGLCMACYNGVFDMAEESLPHAIIGCPQCGYDIKVRVEIIDD